MRKEAIVHMNIYLEMIGYAGTALVVISMMMTSVTRLRILNICGSVLSGIYALCGGAYPVLLLNVCLVGINLFHLLRGAYQRSQEKKKGEKS
jgi:hypothetical protein